MKCTNCGLEVNNSKVRCPKCKEIVNVDERSLDAEGFAKCGNCGFELDMRVRYCPTCNEIIKVDIARENNSTSILKEEVKTEKKEIEDEGVSAGQNLMTAAKVMLIVGLLGVIIGGISLICMKQIAEGIISLTGGIFISVINYLFMFGFGVLIKKVSLIQQNQNKK